MFTGRDALLSVEQAISKVRADEGRLDGALRSAMEEAARLRHQEAEGLRTLARVRLDSMAHQRTIRDLDTTERRALALVENHRRALEAFARRRERAQAALDTAEAEQHDRDQDLAHALEALDEQRHRTAERITSEPSWQAARAAVDGAEQIAANAAEKAALAEADLGAKRKPYEDDPLFMYLWNRKHGQAEDRRSAFVRFFDRKVARLIGYQGARANYAMLQDIPTRLREHAGSKLADATAARDRLAAIERQALVADGIEALEARGETAEASVQAGEEAIVKITAELQEIEVDQQRALGAGDEAVPGGAVDLLARALEGEDLRRLHEEAARTPTRADDQAIASIEAARAGYQRADQTIARIRTEIHELARRRTELEGARDRARRVGYDDPRGTFGGQDAIGAVIGGILGGILRGGDLDRVFRDNYRAPVPRADPEFGRRGRAPSWPRPRGGGGAGTLGGSGARGGGGSGWRTGGRF